MQVQCRLQQSRQHCTCQNKLAVISNYNYCLSARVKVPFVWIIKILGSYLFCNYFDRFMILALILHLQKHYQLHHMHSDIKFNLRKKDPLKPVKNNFPWVIIRTDIYSKPVDKHCNEKQHNYSQFRKLLLQIEINIIFYDWRVCYLVTLSTVLYRKCLFFYLY